MTLVQVTPYQSRPVTNDWGEVELAGSYGEPYEVDVVVAPRSSSETTRAGFENRVIDGLSLFTPPGIRLGAKDVVTVRGVLYQVEGIQGVWENDFDGVEEHGQVALKAVQG